MSGLDALLQRPRPSAWQLFSKQPCAYLAQSLYSRRIVAPPSRTPDALSVVCISDTHNSQPQLPDGDVLIHAGDLTQSGSSTELQSTLAWLRRQPHPVKIVVAGNHDLLLDADHRASQNGRGQDLDKQHRALDWGDIVYLDNEEKTVVCPNGRRLRVYGSPLTLRHGNWAFQYPRSHNVWSAVSPGVDILVTHGPPHAHLDCQYGCRHLLRALWHVRPRLHVFGHVHDGAGTEWVQFDALQAAYERTVSDGGVRNLGWVVLYFLRTWLWPGPSSPSPSPSSSSETKCLLVNAAMVGGLRDDERRRPVQVLL